MPTYQQICYGDNRSSISVCNLQFSNNNADSPRLRLYEKVESSSLQSQKVSSKQVELLSLPPVLHSPKLSPRKVTRVFDNGEQEVIELRFERSNPLVCTPNHPFYVIGQGWKKAISLRYGDVCLSSKGYQRRFISCKILPEKQHVYNIEVEHDHTYYVGDSGGILVHNACLSPKLASGNSGNSSHSEEANTSVQAAEKLLNEWKDFLERMRRINPRSINNHEVDLYYAMIFTHTHGHGHAWLGTAHLSLDFKDFEASKIVEQKYRGFGPSFFNFGGKVTDHNDKIWDVVFWYQISEEEYSYLQTSLDVFPNDPHYDWARNNCVHFVFEKLEEAQLKNPFGLRLFDETQIHNSISQYGKGNMEHSSTSNNHPEVLQSVLESILSDNFSPQKIPKGVIALPSNKQ